MASLELQKTSLDLEPSPEPHQRSVGPDDAMAGDEEGQRVAMIGPAHSPDGFGPADLGRDLRVGSGLAVGDGSKRQRSSVLTM